MNKVEALSPFPEGWYFITSRNSLQKKKLIRKTWMGEEIVAWCDAEGRICVAQAVCPHMGSDLGPDAGGRVRNGCLVCPFHGFEFDTTGQCVATPFAPAPKSARLKVYETREILGLVFAWWGNGGRAPQWHLPDAPPTGAEWSKIGFRSFRFPGHPQETTENSVDLAHLRNPKRPLAELRFLPVKVRHRLMNQRILAAQKRDVLQDVIIWSRKQYRPRPRLSRSDGEVPAHRQHCKQFYPEVYPQTSWDRLQSSSVTG